MHPIFRNLILALSVIVMTNQTFAANPAYMNDAETRQPPKNASLPNISQHKFPRIIMAETQSMAGIEEPYSKYQVISTSAGIIKKVSRLQKKYPDLMYFRQFNAAEYLGYTEPGIHCAQSHGVPFESTAANTSGCSVYAGHWLYRAGSNLQNAINVDTTTVSVNDISRFSNNEYIVIYDAPAGSFKNAEHAKITGRNVNNKTLTLQRGYKSTRRAHAKGSIIAQHVIGQGGSTKNWSFNLSSQSPRDAKGKTYAQAMLDFIAGNYRADIRGNQVDINVSGFLFDSDFHFLFTSKRADVNNNLVTDDGISNTGVNWWGDGLGNFYRLVKNRFSNKYIVGGHQLARGFDALNGAQMEGWPVDSNYHGVNPGYDRINSRLSEYGYYTHHLNEGSIHTHVLTKTPTRIHPDGTNASSNSPFRFALGTALLDDGYMGIQNSPATTDPWYDEYAVNVDKNSSTYGQAIRSNQSNETAVRQNRGWLGNPLGSRTRIENSNFNPANALMTTGTFDNNINGWSGKNITISRSADARDGGGSLRASKQLRFDSKLFTSSIRGPSVNLTKGRWYTLVFSAKAAAPRDLKANVGNFGERFIVGTQWRRYVMSFKAKGDGNQALSFYVGRENTSLNLDSVYLFNSNANIFRRDFENGIVVVNATPDYKTVNLNGTFQRIKGFQDAGVNNGATLNSVAIKPWDAAILVRPKGTGGGNTGGGNTGGGNTGGGNTGGGNTGGGTPAPSLQTIVRANNLPTAKPGPTIQVGSQVNWTYTVKNTGNTPLTNITVKGRQKLPTYGNWQTLCTINAIPVGGSANCSSRTTATKGIYKTLLSTSSLAGNQTANSSTIAFYNGEASTTPTPVSQFNLTVLANNRSTDKPGPTLAIGQTVNWTYRVTNSGNQAINNVTVTEKQKIPTTGNWKTVCTFSSIPAGSSRSCSQSGKATSGTYKKLVTASIPGAQVSRIAFYTGQ